MNTIGERLKEERKKLGYDQAGFGVLGDVNRGTQSRYERNERSPDADYLSAIAVVGADVCYIVTGKQAADKHCPPEEAIIVVQCYERFRNAVEKGEIDLNVRECGIWAAGAARIVVDEFNGDLEAAYNVLDAMIKVTISLQSRRT